MEPILLHQHALAKGACSAAAAHEPRQRARGQGVGIASPLPMTRSLVYSLARGSLSAIVRHFHKNCPWPYPRTTHAEDGGGLIQGGTTLTITGSHLALSAENVEYITIKDIPCTLVSFVSSDELSCVTGPSPTSGAGSSSGLTFLFLAWI